MRFVSSYSRTALVSSKARGLRAGLSSVLPCTWPQSRMGRWLITRWLSLSQPFATRLMCVSTLPAADGPMRRRTPMEAPGKTHRVGDQAAGTSGRDLLQRAVEGAHDVLHAAALACRRCRVHNVICDSTYTASASSRHAASQLCASVTASYVSCTWSPLGCNELPDALDHCICAFVAGRQTVLQGGAPFMSGEVAACTSAREPASAD